MPSLTKIQTGFLEPQGAFELDPGTAGSPGLFFSGNTSTGMFSPSAGVLGFSTGSTQNALTILANGNIGIGTDNPGQTLDVNGNIIIRKSNNLYFETTSGFAPRLTNSADQNSLSIFTNNTEKLRIASDGAITVTSDGGDDDGANITLKHANNNTTDIVSALIFSNNVGEVARIVGRTDGGNNNGGITFHTDNAGTTGERVRITSSGNIGIGTTNPVEILHLGSTTNKQIRLDSSTTVPSYIGSFNDLCNISVNRRSSDGTIIKADRGSSYITLASSGPDTSYILFATTSAVNTQPSTRLYISGTGNIGIGTTNPGTSLDVNGVIRSNTNITVSKNSSFYVPLSLSDPGAGADEKSWRFTLNRTSKSLSIGTQNDASSAAYSAIGITRTGANVENVIFYTLQNNERLRITSTGNVGIGTTNPSGRLEVAYTSDNDGLYVTNTSRGGKWKLATSGGGAENIDFQRYDTNNSVFRRYLILGPTLFSVYTGSTATSTQRFTIVDNGNVGIGTNGPSNKLQIQVGDPSTLGTGSNGLRLSDGTRNSQFTRTGSTYSYGGVTGAGTVLYSYDKLSLHADTNNSITFATGNFERIHIDYFGTTSVGVTPPTQSTLKPDLITGSGVVSPMFFWPFANLTAGASTSGPGYVQLGTGGVRHNLVDPHMGTSLGGVIFQGGLINSYSQTFSNTASNTTREEMNWNRFRIIFRGLCPGTGYNAVTVKFRYSTYWYGTGWSDHSGTEWSFTGNEDARGARWVVGPWINPSDYFNNWADVPVFGLYYDDNSSGRSFRISGGVYFQFAHFN